MVIKRNLSSKGKKKKRQEIKDEIIEDFLEERKQFFDSFCATSLATTPMKHEDNHSINYENYFY